MLSVTYILPAESAGATYYVHLKLWCKTLDAVMHSWSKQIVKHFLETYPTTRKLLFGVANNVIEYCVTYLSQLPRDRYCTCGVHRSYL